MSPAPCDSSGTPRTTDSCALAAESTTGSTLTVDGRLDESVWSTSHTASNFRQLRPQEGASPSQRTTVRVAYGKDALYVGAILSDNNPDQIRARLARRDERNQADWFEVSIDAYLDRKTARSFAVNAAGVQRDGIVQQGRDRLDTSWDAVWRSETRITAEGWIVELAIPYSMLRFSEADQQTWGIQFRRRIPRTSEVLEWPLVPESERRSGLVAEYAELTSLRNLDPQRKLEIAPYTLGRMDTEEADIPGSRHVTANYDVGADLELGLGSNSTLNATINPDFGQVESDPAVLNLSAFETFFEEKRPFFVQGTDVFDFRLGRRSDLLYTRRIGGTDPVIGALKLTGRSQDGLVYGAMAATTGDAFSPSQTYGVTRLRQDIGVQSSIGGMVTAYEGPTREARRRSLAGGLDWDLRFFDNRYQMNGYATTTHRRTTAGGEAPTTGFAMDLQTGRAQGIWTYDLGFQLRDETFNPNDVGRMRQNNYIEVNGGFRHQFNGGDPFGPFQRGSGFLFANQSWTYADRLDRGLGHFSRVGVLTRSFNPISLQFGSEQLFGGFDTFETRGLWPRSRPRAVDLELEIGTDTRRNWELEAVLGTEQRSDGGATWTTGLEAEWNASSRLKLSAEVEYERERDAVEWASNETFSRPSDGQWAIGQTSNSPSEVDAFIPLEQGNERLGTVLRSADDLNDRYADGSYPDGTYYMPIYGARDTDRIDLTLRSNFTLTRMLSFEFFGQLFGARGQYKDFRILTSPHDLSDFSAYPKRHDFATSSFLTNAVLRWEFRPGSELFLVWSQDRRLERDDPFFYDEQSGSPYDESPTSRLTDAFGDFARNSFIVKLRYLFY